MDTLGVGPILIGGIAALEARHADNLISSTTPHLVWSIGMAFLFAVDYWAVASGPLTNLEWRELAVHSRNKQSAP